jgi:hypothetical protein
MAQGSFMSQRDLQAVRDREANVPSTTTLSGNKSPRALRDASDSSGSISLVAAPLIGSCGYVSSRVPDIETVTEHAAAETAAAVSGGLPRILAWGCR